MDIEDEFEKEQTTEDTTISFGNYDYSVGGLFYGFDYSFNVGWGDDVTWSPKCGQELVRLPTSENTSFVISCTEDEGHEGNCKTKLEFQNTTITIEFEE